MLEQYTPNAKQKALKIESEAEKLGGEWGHFSQKVFLNGNTFGSGGVCAAVASVFIARIATGQGAFDEYVSSKDGREDVMNYAIQQKTGEGNLTRNHLKDFGLKFAYQRGGDTIEGIAELIKIKGYYDIGMSDFKGEFDTQEIMLSAVGNVKAHAVVAINDPPKYYFFDPNYGVGAFPSITVASNFLSKFWRNIYKEMREGSTTLSRFYK